MLASRCSQANISWEDWDLGTQEECRKGLGVESLSLQALNGTLRGDTLSYAMNAALQCVLALSGANTSTNYA